jgi:hypothetical protein
MSYVDEDTYQAAHDRQNGTGGHDKTIGSRTAGDLPYGPPPDQLVHPFLTPEGITVLYGRGGVGKGVTACWLVMQLVRAGHVVMILDYEGHEREWGSRMRGLGMTDPELASVHYRAPFGRDWTAPTGALSVVAKAVREDCEHLGVTYFVVDSYSVATSNGDTMGGEQAAREFFTACSTIGLPGLVIAHVRGDSGRFPERPFGTVFVHNFARETWPIERVGDREPDPDRDPYAPNVVSLELHNHKANGRDAAAAQFLTFSFFADGSIEVSTDRVGRSVADLAANVLAGHPMKAKAMIAAIREDTGEKVSEDSLTRALRRHPMRFGRDDQRPYTWSLK